MLRKTGRHWAWTCPLSEILQTRRRFPTPIGEEHCNKTQFSIRDYRKDKLSPEQKAGYVLSRKVGEKWKTLTGAKKDLSRTAVAKSKDIKKSTIASPKQNVQNNLMEQRIKETLNTMSLIL